jgi:hypothetical protein
MSDNITSKTIDHLVSTMMLSKELDLITAVMDVTYRDYSELAQKSIKLLSHDDPEIRKNAIFTLARVNPLQAKVALMTRLKIEEDKDVIFMIHYILESLKPIPEYLTT